MYCNYRIQWFLSERRKCLSLAASDLGLGLEKHSTFLKQHEFCFYKWKGELSCGQIFWLSWLCEIKNDVLFVSSSGTNLKNSLLTSWCWSHRVPPIMKYWCTLKTLLKETSYLLLLRSLVSWAAVKTEIVKTKIILCFLCSIMVWQPESWGFGPQLSGLQVIAWLCIFRIWK